MSIAFFRSLITVKDRRAVSRTYRKPLKDPVLAHIHVPKCGGTAFREFLVQHYGSAHLALYVPDTFFVYSEPELAGYLSDPAVRGFSSHFVRTFPEKLAGRDLLYVSFLRSPVDQFISYISYVKKNYHKIQNDKTLMSCLPPDLDSMSVREIARWILSCDRELNFRENYTVNFFARYTVPGEAGPFRMERSYRRHRLATAKATIDRFFFVGIVEEMDRSVLALRKRMEHHGLSFPPGEVPLDNTSSEFRGDLSWIRKEDEVGSLLLESVREDQNLYEWALARLHGLEGS